MKLEDCDFIVNEYKADLKAETDQLWDKMVEEKAKEATAPSKNYTMSAYYAGMYRDAKYGAFCFENNVFNITTEE
jgi:hypothetical protein